MLGYGIRSVTTRRCRKVLFAVTIYTACRDDAQQFRCNSTSLCVPQLYVCDGWNHCGDWSDELNCSQSHTYSSLYPPVGGSVAEWLRLNSTTRARPDPRGLFRETRAANPGLRQSPRTMSGRVLSGPCSGIYLLACWTQAQKGPDSNRSRDAVG